MELSQQTSILISSILMRNEMRVPLRLLTKIRRGIRQALVWQGLVPLVLAGLMRIWY